MYSSLNGRVPREKPHIYNPMQHFNAHYSTEPLKNEMKFDFENEIFLQNLHFCPDPLKKNLADTVITCEKATITKSNLEVPKMTSDVNFVPKMPSEVNLVPKMPLNQSIEERQDSTLAGIAGFFSGMMNVLTNAMFRTKPAAHHHDCYDAGSRQGSTWQLANTDDQDKIGTTPDSSSDGAMNNCKTVTSCEEKLNNVKFLLSSKPANLTRLRKRPKKVFVEPGSVEDSFEDAFSPEDFVSLSNEPHMECYSPMRHQNEQLSETRAAKTKVDTAPFETIEIVSDITVSATMDEVDSVVENESQKLSNKKLDSENVDNSKNNSENDLTSSERIDNVNCVESSGNREIVIVCEDKLSKLKALLQEKRKNKSNFISPEPVVDPPRPAKTIPIVKPTDKHFKNPCRNLDKRCKTKMKNLIQDDANFANELVETPDNSPSVNSSSGSSLGDYFDELKGRFQNSPAVDSDDSYQIVFNEPNRCRNISDCDSEDSFIVFEDSPDCYTNNDVFGDSESDSESDSGCSTMKLSHSLSRTVSNLTDDTLFESSDEVDCAKVPDSRSLLLNADKKRLRKDQPAKKVRFSSEPPSVRVMRVWAFAAKQARAGHWERYALDRERFKRRIADVDMAVSWVLKPQHRSRVMFQRFMPWWNQERRKEIAEKKEQKRIDEEKRIEEEKATDGQTKEVTDDSDKDISKVGTSEMEVKSEVIIGSEVEIESGGNTQKGGEMVKNIDSCDESDDFKMAAYLKNRNENYGVHRFHDK